jgi:hypothetical protein
MEIVGSVKLSEIDPVFFETSYYVVPDSGGEKPYATLFRALRETRHVALARVRMYGREHVGHHSAPASTDRWLTRYSMSMRFDRKMSSGRMWRRSERRSWNGEAILEGPGIAVRAGGIQGRIPCGTGGDARKESRTRGGPAPSREPAAATKPVVDISKRSRRASG